MSRLVHVALILTIFCAFAGQLCVAQDDCDEELEIVEFEGRPCDSDEFGPRACGKELRCGLRGCGPTGRNLFCGAGRCVAENADEIGYPCNLNEPTCGGGSQCLGASDDVDRCVLIVDPRTGMTSCAAPFSRCVEGYSCERFCDKFRGGCFKRCASDISAAPGE